MKIAVIGATGTAGSRAIAKLKDRGISVVEVSRSTGVDLITGNGLHDALVRNRRRHRRLQRLPTR